MNEFLNNLSDKDLNSLVDKLCYYRDQIPDITVLDQVKNNQENINSLELEEMNIEQEKDSIQNDIIKSIFESDTPISQEEMNVLKAKGIYDKYMKKIRNVKEENNAMNSVEEEIRRNMMNDTLPEITNPIAEELVEIVREESFPEEINEISENKDTIISDEDSEQITVKEENNNHEMTIEEINDVPATTLSVDNDILKESVIEKYDNVSVSDALKLIDVMNRYKAKENFNVFEALPESIKEVINKEAALAGADKSIINFFAKSFINDLVNNTYIDNEIKDFTEELSEVLKPMGNISGILMDEYSDELYRKFTEDFINKAEEIKETDPEKSKQLIAISNNFKQAFNFERIMESIEKTPSNINKAYKTARDNWNKFCNNYRELTSKISPTPRELEKCLSTFITLGYPEEYSKAFIVLVANSIINAVKENTIEEHIYAYYISNAIYTVAFTADNGKVNKIINDNIAIIMDKINDYMVLLTSRNSKKNRKRNKNTRSIAKVYASGVKDPSYPIKEYHGIIENNE